MKVPRNHEGRTIRLTDERIQHIERRQEMAGQEAKIDETVVNPDLVVESQQDPSVHLYHRLYEDTPVSRKYMLVAIKVLSDDAFIVTAFFTDRRKQGVVRWPR
jgi:hypothetical protein